MSNLQIALQITALGMGLVFAAIIVLWGMMNLLTRLTADKTSEAESAAESSRAALPDEEDLRARAAAVAVALALAQQQTSSAHSLAEPPTAIVSAWQLGMRTRQMYQKGSSMRRRARQDDR